MFERYTPQARQVVGLAEHGAKTLKHTYIGTEHLLLGIIAEHEGIAAHTLKFFNVDYESVRAKVAKTGERKIWFRPKHLPFHPDAKTALVGALHAATYRDHNAIGTEHLLSGLLHDQSNTASSMIESLGGSPAQVSQHINRALNYVTHSVEERHMGKRIDYYDDPEAPTANSLVPSVNVFVVNERDEILMIRRTDNDNWAVPGGAIDLGESVPQAAVRETLEETGVTCEITGTVGIYSDPKHIIYYTSDGEARQEFSIVFTARPVSGEPRPSSESKEVVWVPRAKLATYTMDRSMRLRVDHFLSGGPMHIG